MKHVRDDSENTETAAAKTKLHEFVYAVGSGRGVYAQKADGFVGWWADGFMKKKGKHAMRNCGGKAEKYDKLYAEWE